MTAVLNFNLDNKEDSLTFNRMNKSLDLAFCLKQLYEEIYENRKISHKKFFDTLEEYNINFEEILQ